MLILLGGVLGIWVVVKCINVSVKTIEVNFVVIMLPRLKHH